MLEHRNCTHQLVMWRVPFFMKMAVNFVWQYDNLGSNGKLNKVFEKVWCCIQPRWSLVLASVILTSCYGNVHSPLHLWQWWRSSLPLSSRRMATDWQPVLCHLRPLYLRLAEVPGNGRNIPGLRHSFSSSCDMCSSSKWRYWASHVAMLGQGACVCNIFLFIKNAL